MGIAEGDGEREREREGRREGGNEDREVASGREVERAADGPATGATRGSGRRGRGPGTSSQPARRTETEIMYCGARTRGRGGGTSSARGPHARRSLRGRRAGQYAGRRAGGG